MMASVDAGEPPTFVDSQFGKLLPADCLHTATSST
jgi:hypothetical protein